jgi:hypothetical protein
MSSVNVTKDCNRKDPAMWAAAAAPYLKSPTAFHLLNCPNPAHNNMTRRDALRLQYVVGFSPYRCEVSRLCGSVSWSVCVSLTFFPLNEKRAHNPVAKNFGRKCCPLPLVSACTLSKQTVEFHAPACYLLCISHKISHSGHNPRYPFLITQVNSTTICLCYVCQIL